MKKFIILAFLCVAVVVQSSGQKQKQNNKPDEQIRVNKKYDENGNLVQYDSTYVHQLSSDSTFTFSFDHNFDFGDNFPQMFDHLNIDSMLQQIDSTHNFNFFPFDDEDFSGQFDKTFPDSLTGNFHFNRDSVSQYHPDPQAKIQDFLNEPGFDQWQKQLQDRLKQLGQFTPKFQNEEQKKEWEELMKKQQKEKEDLMKKWERSSNL